MNFEMGKIKTSGHVGPRVFRKNAKTSGRHEATRTHEMTLLF